MRVSVCVVCTNFLWTMCNFMWSSRTEDYCDCCNVTKFGKFDQDKGLNLKPKTAVCRTRQREFLSSRSLFSRRISAATGRYDCPETVFLTQ